MGEGKVEVKEVKSVYEPKWPIRPELILVSVALRNIAPPPGWDASPSQGYPQH